MLSSKTAIHGLLILIAGAVLLTPGLLTDTLGFVLLVPPGRSAVRRVVAAKFFQQTQPADPDVIDVEWRRED